MTRSELSRIRELAGMQQGEMARAAKVNQGRLSMAESGLIKLTPKEVRAIRRVALRAMRKRQAAIARFLGTHQEAQTAAV